MPPLYDLSYSIRDICGLHLSILGRRPPVCLSFEVKSFFRSWAQLRQVGRRTAAHKIGISIGFVHENIETSYSLISRACLFVELCLARHFSSRQRVKFYLNRSLNTKFGPFRQTLVYSPQIALELKLLSSNSLACQYRCSTPTSASLGLRARQTLGGQGLGGGEKKRAWWTPKGGETDC